MAAIAPFSAPSPAEIADRLRLVVGPEQVQHPVVDLDDPTVRSALTPNSQPVAVFPKNLDQLAAVVACAHEQRWRLLPWGGGTKLDWGYPGPAEILLSTARLNRLLHHSVGDFTVTVEAGLTLAALQAELGQHQQFLALDAPYPDQATLGGIVATASAGSLRQRYGGVRDMLIGLSFVRHDGQLVKAGGQVVKNVAGYDLMKLMTGAHGSLGVLATLTFRTYPGSAESQTVLLTGSAAEVPPLSQRLLASELTPVACDLLSGELLTDLGYQGAIALAARFQGVPAGVSEQVRRLGDLAQGAGVTVTALQGADEADFWLQAQHLIWARNGPVLLAKLGLLPAELPGLLPQLKTLIPASLPWRFQGHSRSGLGTLRLALDQGTEADLPGVVERVRSHCQQHGGYLTILTAPTSLKAQVDPWGYAGNALPLMTKIKQQFDPHNLLSPGRFVGQL
jgi:glycolate oxidase FAD binding subunit